LFGDILLRSQNVSQPIYKGEKILDKLNSIIRNLDKVGVFCRWTNAIGMLLFFLMVVVNLVDVISRYIFNYPFSFILDMTGIMMLTGVFLAISHTYNMGSHVGVDLISSKLNPRARLMLESVTIILGLVIMAVMVWANFSNFLYTITEDINISQSTRFTRSPLVGILVFGLITLWLLILRDLLKKIKQSIEFKFKALHWTVILGISGIIIILSVFWMQPKLIQLSLPVIGVIGILVFLVFLMSGMPVAFGLILTSFVFIAHIRGFNISMNMLGAEPYTNTSAYSWSVIPFFVLMGYLAFYARFGEDLYYAANRWIGHFRGGLALATVAACTGMAAIVGDSVSCVATMSAIARPEMKKYGYDDRLTTGSIVAGATLGPIIPPSVPFIVYGVLTSVSIGTLFVAGIVPGIIMAALFCVTIYIWTRINPRLANLAGKSTWKERFFSLRAGGPILIIFLFVIGGMFLGMFTPTEGGAMGASAVVVLALIMRRYTRANFTKALVEAGNVTSIVFLILIGAVLFTRFGVWCNLSGTATSFLTGLGLTPLLVIALIYFIFFVLGFAVDSLALTLIGVPIVHPIAVGLGFDPIWFAVLLIIVINVGTITPPVALNLFVIKALNQDIPIDVIFRGALPFVLGTVASIILFFFVPNIITWLPSIIK
jgi:tripartite ATP-independent transporter DctM subunit